MLYPESVIYSEGERKTFRNKQGIERIYYHPVNPRNDTEESAAHRNRERQLASWKNVKSAQSVEHKDNSKETVVIFTRKWQD